jgi:hypothetical protein
VNDPSADATRLPFATRRIEHGGYSQPSNRELPRE